MVRLKYCQTLIINCSKMLPNAIFKSIRSKSSAKLYCVDVSGTNHADKYSLKTTRLKFTRLRITFTRLLHDLKLPIFYRRLCLTYVYFSSSN